MTTPDDKGEVPPPPAGGPRIAEPEADDDDLQRLHAIAKERLIRGITTNELMKLSRGDPAEDPPLKK